MKKKIISILLVVLLILCYGWSKLTKASDIKEFSAKFIVNNSLINTGDIIELNYQYKINGQGKNISNISLTHSIPSNFEVINLPDSNWTVEGNMIKANDLNSSDGMYSFTIKLKAKSFGKIDTFGIATIEYNYNLGNDKTKKKVTETVIAKAFDKNNNEVTNLIIDNTSVNLQANIINKRVENGINYIYLDEPLQVEYKLIPEGEVKVDRKPVDIVLVIDTSTSMRGSKIEAAKFAAKDLINTIYNKCIETNCDDKVSIIGFSTQVNINNPLVSVKESNNKETLINKIDSLNANGFTNIHDGLLKAKANLNSDNRDVDKHIIVLTDGMPNYYINNNGKVERDTSTDNKVAVGKVYEEIDNIKNIGYKVHFIGLDTENGAIKKEFFDTVDKKDAGISKLIKSTSELQPLYEQIYQAITKSVVYSELKLEQSLPPNVKVEDVIVGGTKLDPSLYLIDEINKKLIINLNNIVFENKKGTPDLVNINVKYKALNTGVLELGEARIVSKKLIEGREYDYEKRCQIENIEIRPRDFYNYINFSNLQVNRTLIPNNTFVTLSVDVTNNKLFNLDPNARVELVVTPISDGSVEVKKEVQENKFIFNSYSSNISERFRLKIIQDSEKQKEVDFKVTSIKVTFKGTEYNITQDIYKYFGETTPSITVMVKKFTLR